MGREVVAEVTYSELMQGRLRDPVLRGVLALEPREPELHPRRWTKVHWRHR
jgi:hypothetical protein